MAGSAAACFLISVVAIYCSAMAVIPRIRGPARSVIFFGPVSEQTAPDYVAKLASLSDGNFLAVLGEQIQRHAGIARDKHQWVGRATLAPS